MLGEHPEAHLLVVFGATGDLARHKLFPAYGRLVARGALPEAFVVLGVARTQKIDDEGLREQVRGSLRDAGVEGEAVERWCAERLFFQTVADEKSERFVALARRIEELEREFGLPGNRVLYLALPPGAFPHTVTELSRAGLAESPGWTRLVVEKPFGRDLASARELNELVHRCFHEEQVYRIDHYLGKETVQNLLVFRFANPVWESVWHRDRVESVRITVAESVGAGERAGYYDQAGALRDMVQNHLTQLLTLVAMEVPGAFGAEAIRQEKVKVLRNVLPIGPDDVVFGQYARGPIDGREVPGYLEEEEVPDDSETPTYVALRLQVGTWRWQGVPFLLCTGKRMAERSTRITITFRPAPVSVFHPQFQGRLLPNVLEITIQPDEGFALSFEVKAPGHPLRLVPERLDFRYDEVFEPLPEAYETLLLDVLTGDQTLFVHADEVEASWALYAPLLEGGIPLYPYPAGSWGPAEADRLLATADGAGE